MIRTTLLAGALTLAFCGAATPHKWYEYDCCHERDCAPVADDRIEETRDGYVVILKGGEHPSFPNGAPERRYEIAKDDPRIRRSRDFRFHPCVPPATMNLLCLYVPPGAV